VVDVNHCGASGDSNERTKFDQNPKISGRVILGGKFVLSINQSINQSWIYIAHERNASNALVR